MSNFKKNSQYLRTVQKSNHNKQDKIRKKRRIKVKNNGKQMIISNNKRNQTRRSPPPDPNKDKMVKPGLNDITMNEIVQVIKDPTLSQENRNIANFLLMNNRIDINIIKELKQSVGNNFVIQPFLRYRLGLGYYLF